MQRWLDRQFMRLAVLPTTAMMLLIFGIPLAFSFYLSFEGWAPEQALFAGKFAGTANYEDLLTDPQFLKSLSVTFIYTATTVATELACGLGIALLLNIDLPWIGLFRTALVVPMMITPIVAALCWKLLLDPDHGVVNYWIGSHIVWLGRPDTALISVMVVNLWQNAPYVAVLLLAGLRSLPSEPVEAASIDGASRLAGVLAHHAAAAAAVHPGGAAAAHDLRVPRVRQHLRDDQRRAGERHDVAVDVHLSRVVRAVRPQPGRRGVLADAADVPAAVPVLHRRDPPAGGELMSALSGVGSRRSKLVFAGSVYLGADRDDRGVPVPAALGHRPVAQDAAAGVRHAAAVRLVADAGELCRRAGPGRLPAGVRQQPGGVLGRGDPVDLRRRAGGVCLRALPVPRRLVPVLLAAGHAHAAADRGAGADVHPVQQARPDHDAASA